MVIKIFNITAATGYVIIASVLVIALKGVNVDQPFYWTISTLSKIL